MKCTPWMTRLMISIWGDPLRGSAASLFIYAFLMAGFAPAGFGQSKDSAFVYLADAFLRGQLHLAQLPASTLDLVLYKGQYYLYWPPFPAIVFMPLVALFGVGVSDALVSLLSAAANVFLVAAILAELDRQGIVVLNAGRRACLTVFFVLGTVHLTLAIYPRVWFTAQLLSFTLLGSAYLVLLRGRSAARLLLAGSLLAAAVLTRNSTLMAGIGLLWLCWRSGPGGEWRLQLRSCVLLALPVALALGFLGLYNYARFGNPLNVGLAYHLMSDFFADNFRQYGTFHPHYIVTNLYYNFVHFPYLALFGPNPETEFWMGGSLLLMSPVYLLALPGIVWMWRRGGAFLAVSCLTGLVPMMLLMGTGWVTFGPRYTFDVGVPLTIATAFGASRIPTRVIGYLTVISVLIYLPGVLMLGKFL